MTKQAVKWATLLWHTGMARKQATHAQHTPALAEVAGRVGPHHLVHVLDELAHTRGYLVGARHDGARDIVRVLVVPDGTALLAVILHVLGVERSSIRGAGGAGSN